MPGIGRLHQLVAKNAKLFKYIYKQASNKLAPLVRTPGVQQPIFQTVPIRASNQPIHPLALKKQIRSHWFSSPASKCKRGFVTSAKESTARGIKYDRASFAKSRTATAVAQHTGRAPFASTLRPNLTGGTLARTSCGYSLGSGRVGGARYFSHGPAPTQEVIQNVGQAVRAFYLGGKRAQYDGQSRGFCGGKSFKSVSTTQRDVQRKMQGLPKTTPGSWVEFNINPTITALTPLGCVVGSGEAKTAFCAADNHLNSTGLLDVLSTDFSRTLKDLAAIMSDLKKLANLGDLPITYCDSTTLRVHFPGCDTESVERICDELGIHRGAVFQDDLFDTFAGTEIALLFPFAPSEGSASGGSNAELCIDAPRFQRCDQYSTQSEHSFDQCLTTPSEMAPWSSDSMQEDYTVFSSRPRSAMRPRSVIEGSDPLEYRDFEGIYRFIEMCDNAPRL